MDENIYLGKFCSWEQLKESLSSANNFLEIRLNIDQICEKGSSLTPTTVEDWLRRNIKWVYSNNLADGRFVANSVWYGKNPAYDREVTFDSVDDIVDYIKAWTKSDLSLVGKLPMNPAVSIERNYLINQVKDWFQYRVSLSALLIGAVKRIKKPFCRKPFYEQ